MAHFQWSYTHRVFHIYKYMWMDMCRTVHDNPTQREHIHCLAYHWAMRGSVVGVCDTLSDITRATCNDIWPRHVCATFHGFMCSVLNECHVPYIVGTFRTHQGVVCEVRLYGYCRTDHRRVHHAVTMHVLQHTKYSMCVYWVAPNMRRYRYGYYPL